MFLSNFFLNLEFKSSFSFKNYSIFIFSEKINSPGKCH